MGEENDHNSTYSFTDALDRNISLRKKNGSLSEVIISLFRDSYFIQPDAMRFAILGDLHGHITLALNQIHKWEQFSNLKFDAILQVGDIGAFNEHTVLDKVTLEMSEKDPDELGFKNYLNQSKEGDFFFGENGVLKNTPFYFINGNHDDLKLLESKNNDLNKICYYSQIEYIPSGKKITLEKKDLKSTIGSLGYTYANRDLKLISNDINILLSHVPPKSHLNEYGDQNITELKTILPDAFHFFGHSHDQAVSQSVPYKNQYGLNEVNIKKGELKQSSIGFLEISQTNSQFLYLPSKLIPKKS
ncbi:metallophosphoesterase [Candidatus Woesearchaeota archaeon]|jgi:predicted phosphodiesterase|nr:metallophosphoesterase [Candidatus Woesearchaeota archaeon]MBT6519299.1 metallophosphoesterase [Candidatus Woesearchaeota archaeon]MBT7368952.1 metallophosphoesterase [Candidatus Woesearchaeota archaeon]